MNYKLVLRKMLRIREKETIRDGLNRHYVKTLSLFNRVYVSISTVESYLKELGIEYGDTIIVHCSWRSCYSFDFSPEILVQSILKLIGDEGTLLMPCYGFSKEYFDVNNTPSHAGVLSEVFRKFKGTIRSEFPDSAMCGYGKNAEVILSNHINSTYAFDKFSPYTIAIEKYNAKILLIGMGRNPHKISAFHCAAIGAINNNEYYNKIYSKECLSTIINNNGERIQKRYIDRCDGVSNNIKVFKFLVKKICKKNINKGSVSLMIFNGMDAYKIAKKFCDSGGKLYVCHRYN